MPALAESTSLETRLDAGDNLLHLGVGVHVTWPQARRESQTTSLPGADKHSTAPNRARSTHTFSVFLGVQQHLLLRGCNYLDLCMCSL